MVQITVKKEQFEGLFKILLKVGGSAKIIPIADTSSLSKVLVDKKSTNELEFIPMDTPHLEDQRHVYTVEKLLRKGHITSWYCKKIPVKCELEIPFWKFWLDECKNIECTVDADFIKQIMENQLPNGVFTSNEKKILHDLFIKQH